MSVNRRHSDELSRLGVQVHDVRSWPVAIVPNRVWLDYVRPYTRFHTTQGLVCLDGADEKMRVLRPGQRPYVTAIAVSEFGDRDL
jgi:hypothetical protein